MKLVDAFFQISHSKDLSQTREDEILQILEVIDSKNENFKELFPIFISLNSKNIEVFNKLSIAKEFTSLMFQTDSLEKEKLTCYKTALLYTYAKLEDKYLEFTLNSLEALQKKRFISKADYVSAKVLVESFLPREEEEEILEIDENSSDKEKFNLKLTKLFNAIDKISNTSSSESFKESLEEIKTASSQAKFSIGITGVMNAGKSTMLNAVLGREILGTSVVPETANLTVIKHSTTERAKVSFWRESEWELIKEEAQSNDSLKEFVDASEEFFQDSLSEYITKEGKSVDIPINSLANYTSAKHSDLKCNLVRSVELFTNLEYVKNGVEIVDTPGIDDPVMQREEITKEYLRECDVLVHLMNANQSATQKDIDFILDALLYQNITRLLVVITRVDTVSKEELEEVIAYTKESLKNQLTKVEKSSLIDSVLEKLEFIPIAGKMALLHRIGKEKEAQEKGYSLEDSGLLAVEEYLSKILFGDDNPKTKLLIASSLGKVEKRSKEEIITLQERLNSLEKGEENLRDELKALERKRDKTLSDLSSCQSSVTTLLEELREYVDSQDNFFVNEMSYFYKKYLKRVVENINHKASNKEKLERDIIKFIVEFGIKDNLIDIARDYRYTIIKRSNSAWENAEEFIESFNKKNELELNFERSFDSLLDDSFIPRFLTKNNSSLIDKIEDVVNKINKRNTDKTQELIEPHIKTVFSSLEKNLYKARDTFKDEFFETLEKDYLSPFSSVSKRLQEKEKNIRDSIKELEDGGSDIEIMKEDLAQEIAKLTASLNKLESADELI